MRYVLVVALCVTGLPVMASAQSTTTCTNYVPGMLTCQTREQPGFVQPPRYSDYLTDVQKGADSVQQQIRQINRVQAGRLIAAGRCDDARDLPLRAGDLELAQQVQTVCASRPAQ